MKEGIKMLNFKELKTVYIKNKDIDLYKMLDLAFLRRNNKNLKIEVKDIEDADSSTVYYLDTNGYYKEILDSLSYTDLSIEERGELTDIIENNINELNSTLDIKFHWGEEDNEEVKEKLFNVAIMLTETLLKIFINNAKCNIKFKIYLESLKYTKVILLDRTPPSMKYIYNIDCNWLGEPLANGKYILRCIKNQVNEGVSLMLKFTSILNFKSINNIYNFKINENEVSLIFFNKEDTEKFAERYLNN